MFIKKFHIYIYNISCVGLIVTENDGSGGAVVHM